MSKHKLAGYAIKGDGTQETAERIRKVFEADGYENKQSLLMTGLNYYTGIEKTHLGPAVCETNLLYQLKPIPLTEAEALVFGELKVGMMILELGMKVVFDGKIYTLEDLTRYIHTGYCDAFLRKDKETVFEVTTSYKNLRRATLRDFLSTLPEDIAERALRQVDENSECYEKHPESLDYAVACIGEWREKEEGYQFWNCVAHGEYDRARELLRPATDENRVGKWWKHEDGSIIFGVEYDEEGNLHGYGFDAEEHFNWSHYEGNTHYWPCCKKKQLRTLTPADPKEVERMLVAEAKKRGFVKDVEYYIVDRSEYIEGYPDEKRKATCSTNVNYIHYEENNEHVLISGMFAIYSNGQWATIIESSPDTEQPPCDSEVASDFPRMMWVWFGVPKEALRTTIEQYYAGSDFPWGSECGMFANASDTHPVTGQPATEKSVVEQIREVVHSDKTAQERVCLIQEIITKNDNL